MGQGLGVLQSTHPVRHLQVTDTKASRLLMGSLETQAQSEEAASITLESFCPPGRADSDLTLGLGHGGAVAVRFMHPQPQGSSHSPSSRDGCGPVWEGRRLRE